MFQEMKHPPMGMPGFQMPEIAPINQQIAMPAPQPKRGGMFGGKAMDAIAGGLAAFSAGMGNPAGAAIFSDMLRRRQMAQEQAMAEEQYQRRLADQRATWVQQQMWKLQNPDKPNPTEFERVVEAAGYQPGTPEYRDLMRQRAQSQANPPYYFTDPTTGQVMSVPRNAPMGGAAPQGVTFTPIDDGGQSVAPAGGFR